MSGRHRKPDVDQPHLAWPVQLLLVGLGIMLIIWIVT